MTTTEEHFKRIEDSLKLIGANAALESLTALRSTIAEMEHSYVPQNVAGHCLDALEAAGMGKPGKPNTLWAMVDEAVGQIAALTAERDREIKQRTGYGTQIVRLLAERDAVRAEREEVLRFLANVLDSEPHDRGLIPIRIIGPALALHARLSAPRPTPGSVRDVREDEGSYYDTTERAIHRLHMSTGSPLSVTVEPSESGKSGEQPPPSPNNNPHVIDAAIDLLESRRALGRERYKTPLQVGNGRDFGRDADEEMADWLIYWTGYRIEHAARVRALLAMIGRQAEELAALNQSLPICDTNPKDESDEGLPK